MHAQTTWLAVYSNAALQNPVARRSGQKLASRRQRANAALQPKKDMIEFYATVSGLAVTNIKNVDISYSYRYYGL
jgi:hypothetical protein